MNIKTMKTTGLSMALATAFLVAAGGSSAFAQDWRGLDRDRDGRIDSSRELLEERRGFNDGLIAGRRDALARLSFKPSASIRYQRGGFDYRQGFQNGYAQAYRRNANNFWSRDNDWYSRNDNSNRDGYRNDQYRQRGYYDQWGNFHRY
jgi:hypothetical protein